MPSLSIKPPSEGLVCELGWKMSGGKLKNKLGHLGFEGECWVAYSTFMLSLTYPEGNLKTIIDREWCLEDQVRDSKILLQGSLTFEVPHALKMQD
ncbi:hypothetical protein Acr_18g0002820 [Actinidia rufa]|uniref:Uncharacterized protein n=1 Tax=Actinidia rufa TaxID=165716 RepID=A0A7J0G5W2_9ERIC|nr:hypothetical protein Acr_18g0002820 [Actinidia rufa]